MDNDQRPEEGATRRHEEPPTQRHEEIPARRSAAERIPWQAVEAKQPPKETPEKKKTPPVEPPESGLYVPWWGFAVVIMVVAVITCGIWGVVLLNRGNAATVGGPTPTAIFIVITPTATLGADITETPTLDSSSLLTDVPLLETPTVEAQSLQIGSTVKITGTEGDGLSIRQGPGVSFTVFFIGDEGEVFVIEDGPRDADGYIWWYIVGSEDRNRAGWAVNLFLALTSQ